MIFVLYSISERIIQPPLPIKLEFIAKVTRNSNPCSLRCVWKSHTPPSHHSRYIETITRSTASREFFASGIFLRKCRLEGVLNIHGVLFSLFQGLSMQTYSRVYFSLCLFSAISGRSQTQRKLNQRKKFPIYCSDPCSLLYFWKNNTPLPIRS